MVGWWIRAGSSLLVPGFGFKLVASGCVMLAVLVQLFGGDQKKESERARPGQQPGQPKPEKEREKEQERVKKRKTKGQLILAGEPGMGF